MKLRTLRKEEDGAVAVIVAISLTVLLGITALAVDFGRMAACRQSLQNAADAAALAVAADVGRGRSRTIADQTLDTYCTANGFDPDDADVTAAMTITGKTVTVTVEQRLDMGFSAILTGEHSRSVSASATAKATSIFGDCPYAMFAGQRIEDDGVGITIGGNNIIINGNIHSNSDITMRHAVLGSGAIATAVRNVLPSTDGWNSNSIALDMPSMRSFESALDGSEHMVEFPATVVKSNSGGFQAFIDSALTQYHTRWGSDFSYLYRGLYIHVAGDLTFNGSNASAYTPVFPIILIVDGNIDLNGASLDSSRDYPIAVMSKTGNITVNGGGATYTGIIYAPKGDVILNGNDAAFLGMIVGQNIRKTGGKITVSYYEDADRYLPTTKVHLIA